LTTTRCSHPLCNTQHTTTPRNQEPTTPTPRPRQSNTQHHSTEHQGCVREPRPGADQKKQPQPPQRRPECLLRTQQCAEPPRKPGESHRISRKCSTQPHHTPNPQTRSRRAVHGAESDERRTNPQHADTQSTHSAWSPHHTVSSLERR